MHAISSRTATYGPSRRRRALSFLLALAIEILLLLAFLSINSEPKPKPEFQGGRLSTFEVSPDDQDNSRSVQKQATAAAQPPRLAPPVPKPAIRLPDRPLPMIVVTPEVFAASDIAKLGSNAPGAAGGRLAQGPQPGDSERVGTGPNGEPLYAAEWYREPTHQELLGYLPKRMPEHGGWGMVACRTVERFHVDDCVEIGNGPPGSHLASAVRQAAWQFLVRPPRVGGKVMVGQWVRIRISYMEDDVAAE
jgi:protein TonB